MAAKTVDKEIQHYWPLLRQEEKVSILGVVKSFIQLHHENSERISVRQYNKELEEAMAEIERGEFYMHDEVVKMSKEWTKKNGR